MRQVNGACISKLWNEFKNYDNDDDEDGDDYDKDRDNSDCGDNNDNNGNNSNTTTTLIMMMAIKRKYIYRITSTQHDSKTLVCELGERWVWLY